MNTLELLINLRGGLPERCDFCDQPYEDGVRWPVPEEGGAWSCNECDIAVREKRIPE